MTIDRSISGSIYWNSQKERNKILLDVYKRHKMEPNIHSGRLLEPYVYDIFSGKYLGHGDDIIDRYQKWFDNNREIYKYLVEIGDLKPND